MEQNPLSFKFVAAAVISFLMALPVATSRAADTETSQAPQNVDQGKKAQDCVEQAVAEIVDPGIELAHQQRKELLDMAVKNGVPVFMRDTPTGQVPVLLLSRKSYPKLEPFFKNSMSTSIKLVTGDGGAFDHGTMRVGTWHIDLYHSGSGYGEIHYTGLRWKDVGEYINHIGPHSKKIVEQAFALTPEEMNTADYYHRVRRAAIFRAPHEFFGASGGNENHLWDVGTAENCFTYGVGRCTPTQISEMRRTLYNLGASDIPALFNDPRVVEFLKDVKAQVLNADVSTPEHRRNTDGHWQVLQPSMIDKPEYWKLLGDAVPAHLSHTDKMKFISYLIGASASEDYQKLTQSLWLDGNFFSLDRPRTTAIIFWDTPEAAQSFRDANYSQHGRGFHFGPWGGENHIVPQQQGDQQSSP